MGRKYYKIAFFMILLTLVACGKSKEPTVEETVLMKAFIGFVSAKVYDKTCNEGKITASPVDKDVNINWYGNQQILIAMMAAPMRIRHPEDSVDDGVKRLLNSQEKIESKTQAVLDEKGCSSAEALKMKESLALYNKTPPWTMHAIITKMVEKQGGKMTRLTDEQNKVKPTEDLPAVNKEENKTP